MAASSARCAMTTATAGQKESGSGKKTTGFTRPGRTGARCRKSKIRREAAVRIAACAAGISSRKGDRSARSVQNDD